MSFYVADRIKIIDNTHLFPCLSGSPKPPVGSTGMITQYDAIYGYYIIEIDNYAPVNIMLRQSHIKDIELLYTPLPIRSRREWLPLGVDWGMETKCECGSDKINAPGHSQWCPKYEEIK